MSPEEQIERVFRRDRLVSLGAMICVTLLAWAYILRLSLEMDMSAMDVSEMMSPEISSWSITTFLLIFMMWIVMMIGMMLPSVAPMVLIYARVARQAYQRNSPFPATAWFAAGYLTSWVAFSFIATLLQWWLEQLALLSPRSMTLAAPFGGIVLIAAGAYQWLPLKEKCLTQCQSPLVFIQKHGGFRRNVTGALNLGLQHGTYCVGCCWALMALLFVGGVMNVLWIAALAVFVLLEKVSPISQVLSRAAGAALILIGFALIFERGPF